MALPHGIAARRAWRRPERIRVRVAVVGALRRIGTQNSIAAIAYAVLRDVSDVREPASAALVSIGPRSVPALTAAIRDASNWTTAGMTHAIRTLGEIGDVSAIATLVEILKGHVPRLSGKPARRWLWISCISALVVAADDIVVLGAIGGIDLIKKHTNQGACLHRHSRIDPG
jgi:HEAT repeat protein